MTETVAGSERPKLNEWKFILALTIVPFCARFYLLATQECITKDAPLYIDVAQRLSEGEFAQAMKVGYQPLYPALIAAVHAVVGDWILAGHLVSVLCSSLAVIPLILIVKRLFGESSEWRPIAVLTAFFYATIPIPTQLSSEIFTTGCYLFFFLLAYASALQGLAEWRARDFALATLWIVCAYLVRPDALVLIPLLLIWVVVVNIGAFRQKRRRIVVAAGIVIGTFIILASPYLIHSLIHKGLGGMLTSKFNIVIDHREGGGAPAALADLGGSLAATFFYWPILFLFFGLIRRKMIRAAWSLEWFVLASILIFTGILLWLGLSKGYSSKRHMVPIVVLLLPWAAAGFLEVFARLKALKFLSIGVMIALVTFVPKAFRPLGYDKAGERMTGEWVRALTHDENQVMTSAIRPYFYAFDNIRRLDECAVERLVWSGKIADYDSMIAYMRSNGRRYLIADDSMEELKNKDGAGFFDAARIDPRWEQIFGVSKRPDRREPKDMIFVFHLRDEPVQ